MTDGTTTSPPPRVPLGARLPARLNGPAILLGLGLIVLAAALAAADRSAPALYRVGMACIVVGILCAFLPRRVRVPPLVVASPVRGRWEAMNSPASRVPSHGTHEYGQTYAIDLVHVPQARPRPRFGDGPQMRPPTDYPAFGEPVHAPAAGVVVRAVDGRRDHRARSGWLGLLYLLVEGVVRSLGGPPAVLGNHVTLRVEDGTYLVLAHLRRGTVAVRHGEQVRAGQLVAECGNSGNSSEPHLHAQRMDHPSALRAAGLPWAVGGAADDGGDGLPSNGSTFDGVPATPPAG